MSKNMYRFSMLILAVLVLGAAHDAYALRLGGEKVVLPIVGRFPGVNGSQWRTDVFIDNPYTPEVVVTVRFYPSGGTVQTRTITIGAFSSLALPDIVLNTFGMTNAAGPLELSSATVDARARIYNAGNPAGQFGQNVPGIADIYLNRQAKMYGLSGINGNRLNVGVTNPNDVDMDVVITVQSGTNTLLHQRTVHVAAHSNVQYNDVFTTFGIPPQDNLKIHFDGVDKIVYGYASEVRNDTGDAIFIFGLSPNA
jgi:hypothetical protein